MSKKNESNCNWSMIREKPVLLYPVYTIQPVVKPGCTTSLTPVLNEQPLFVQPVQPLFVQPVVKTGCRTGLTTGCIHNTWQLVVLCIQTFTRLSNRFDNRIDNRLYRVNGALITSSTAASAYWPDWISLEQISCFPWHAATNSATAARSAKHASRSSGLLM